MFATIPRLTALLLLLSTLSCAAANHAQRSYHTQTGSTVSSSIWQMQTTPSAITMVTTSNDGVINRFSISPTHKATTVWEFIDPLNNTHVHAFSVGKTIKLSGVLKGTKVQQSCNLDQPWWQPIPWNLEQMLGDNKDQATFVAIRPSDLKCHDFVAQRLAEQPEVSAAQKVRVEVRLTGAYNKFWKAQYWFDAHTDQFIRYQAKHGLFAKPTVVQLQELNLSPAAQ